MAATAPTRNRGRGGGSRQAFGLILLAALAAITLPVRAEPAVKSFAHLDRIRYDGQCLTIDGRDTFIFSGSFHYFRCPRPLWRDRFRRIKEAGCNAVETYVPWDWHERAAPRSLDDYSQIGLEDFKAWLAMAQDEFGLYTIIRPGPYICAEWDGGGFPRWLLPKVPPGSLRSDQPDFLAWSRHWMKAVCPVIAAGQITRRPPGHGGVILVQIENEYDLDRETPELQRAPQLRALYEAAVAGGIEVPIFTCLTRQTRDSSDPELGQVFDAVNSYPRFDLDITQRRIRELREAQPDAPIMVSELQGGWFGQVGGLLSEDQPGLTPAQLTAHTLLAIEEGATLLNYYMIFGGTNFGLWAARGQTQSYDYDAPIRETGAVGDKYAALAGLGRLLREHGSALARSKILPCQAETGSPDISLAARRDRAGGTYIFVRNRSVDAPRRGSAVVWIEHQGECRVDYDLGPFGSKVLYLAPKETDPANGRWLPETGALPARPEYLPAPVRPAFAQKRNDPGGTDLVDAPAGVLLPALGVLDSRPVVYSLPLTLPDSGDVAASLHWRTYPGDARSPPDPVTVSVNGRTLTGGDGQEGNLGFWLHPGPNAIRLLYLQLGQPNFGPGIQDRPGLRALQLRLTRGGANAEIPAQHWTLERELGGEAAGWTQLPPGDAPGWTRIALPDKLPLAKRGKLADTPEGAADAMAVWYRVSFVLPAPDPKAWVPWHARLNAAGDGLLYLNGHFLGRYWEEGPQREYYLPECWLSAGPGRGNVLTLCLCPVARGTRLSAVEIAPYAGQAEVRQTSPL